MLLGEGGWKFCVKLLDLEKLEKVLDVLKLRDGGGGSGTVLLCRL